MTIQRLRGAAGLTQEQVASMAGLTRSHFQYMERGLTRAGDPANPTLLSLVAVSQALGVQLVDLLPASAPDVTAGR